MRHALLVAALAAVAATGLQAQDGPIAPGEAATGMAFDAANHRLFIGCATS
jgi:hypothetical protein